MNSIVQFGEFKLYPGERRLECCGQPVKIGGRALDLLAALAVHQGEVVEARELMKLVWPKSVVTSASLRAHIVELRKALSAASPNCDRLILNIPGRGYQLAVAPVALTGNEVAASSPTPYIFRDSNTKSRVFGRDVVVRQVLDLLVIHPIVTLVAPGGMGKTTVATAVLEEKKNTGSETLLVDLSSVENDGLVAQHVARAAGLTQLGDAAAALVQLLRSRNSLLLVLDCCERAIAGVAELSEHLVRQIPILRILATSREPLHVYDERVVRLPSLEIEATDATDRATHGPAVELFIARAQAADVQLQVPRDLPLIAKICHGLDGMPLAIELAAAHLMAYGLNDLSSLISSGFRLANLGSRTAAERHRTLEATFDWSYRLLEHADRQIFEWLAVFEGGASLKAILEVLADTGQDPTQISHGLARLVDKSLIKLVPHASGGVYRLLDTARAFAADRLIERGEVLAARRSHAQYMLRAVSASQIEGNSSWAIEWFGPRAPNIANLRAALVWARSEPSARSLAISLSAGSAPTFLQLSLLEECEMNCERALTLLPSAGGEHSLEATRLMAYRGGVMVATRGPEDATLEVMKAAQARAEQTNDAPSRALVLSGLFWLWMYRDDPIAAARAANDLHKSSQGDPGSALLRDNSLAYSSTLIGDQEDALTRLNEVQDRNLRLSHGRFMRIGSDPNVFNRVFVVKTHWLRGEIRQARAMYQRHLETLQRPEHGLYYCWALNEVIIPMHCFLGEWNAARTAAQELAEAATRQTMSARQHAAACISLAIDVLQQKADLDTYMEAVNVLRERHFATLLAWLDGVASQEAVVRGQVKLATRLMDRAIERCDPTGSRWWLSELHRIRGMCLLNGNAADRENAVQEFRLACEIAQSQRAAALELSAVVEWGRSMPEGPDEEVRKRLHDALLKVPEMSDQALAEKARRLLSH